MKGDSKNSQNTAVTVQSRRKSQKVRKTTGAHGVLTENNAGVALQTLERLEEMFARQELPRILRPGDGNVPSLLELRVPRSLNDISGKNLGEKLQEIAAWKAYVDQEIGVARAAYALVSVEKQLNPREEDAKRAYGVMQAYMRKLEGLGDALKTMYDALSRQVAIREQRFRSEGGKRYT